jgi:hypothetical protein
MVILLLWLQLALGLSTIPSRPSIWTGMKWSNSWNGRRASSPSGAAADQIRDVAPVFSCT